MFKISEINNYLLCKGQFHVISCQMCQIYLTVNIMLIFACFVIMTGLNVNSIIYKCITSSGNMLIKSHPIEFNSNSVDRNRSHVPLCLHDIINNVFHCSNYSKIGHFVICENKAMSDGSNKA